MVWHLWRSNSQVSDRLVPIYVLEIHPFGNNWESRYPGCIEPSLQSRSTWTLVSQCVGTYSANDGIHLMLITIRIQETFSRYLLETGPCENGHIRLYQCFQVSIARTVLRLVEAHFGFGKVPYVGLLQPTGKCFGMSVSARSSRPFSFAIISVDANLA